MLSKPKWVIIILSAVVVAYGLVGGVLEKVSAEEDDAYRQLHIFTEVLGKVKSDYVEQPSLEKAFQGALQGMVEALDPFSSFVPAGVYAELKDNLDMAGSPGLILSKRYGYLYVVAVTPGSPAEREGLRTGDLVESIDDTVTMRMSVWEGMARLQGPPGSEVKLRVVRARRTEPSVLTLTRATPGELSLSSRIHEGEIGYLKVPAFAAGSADQILDRLTLLKASPVRGLLIDLRGNAVGELGEAVKAADLLLPRGLAIVVERSRDGAPVDHPSLQDPVWEDLPLVILADGGTSGAAEVFAAALQDHGRAEVVGERTNGEGSTQASFELDGGARLFVSTTLYVRPNGVPLQGETLRESGVRPDLRSPNQEFVTSFYFENTSEDFDDELVDKFYRELDEAVGQEQLSRALEHVREKVLKKAA